MRDVMFRTLVLVATALVLGACGTVIPKTDLMRLYATQEGNPDQPPVVIIHGALGSRLWDPVTGDEHWPGNLGELAFSDYRSLRLEIDPVIENAEAIVDRIDGELPGHPGIAAGSGGSAELRMSSSY